MNRNGNLALWIVLAVVGAILVLGAGIGIKYAFTPKQPTQQTSPLPAPEAVVDEAADSKVYRNEKYGFEFKYPQDWSAKVVNYQLPAGLPLDLIPVFISRESVEYAFSIATPSKKNEDFMLIVGGSDTAPTGAKQPERPTDSFDMIIGKIGKYKNSGEIQNQFQAWEEENQKERTRLSSFAPDDERSADSYFKPTATIVGNVDNYDSIVYAYNISDPTSAESWIFSANIFHDNLVFEVYSRFHNNTDDIQLFLKVLNTLKFF